MITRPVRALERIVSTHSRVVIIQKCIGTLGRKASGPFTLLSEAY